MPEKLSHAPHPPPAPIQHPRAFDVAPISPPLLVQCVRSWLGNSVPSHNKGPGLGENYFLPLHQRIFHFFNQVTATCQVMLLEVQKKTKQNKPILHSTARVFFSHVNLILSPPFSSFSLSSESSSKCLTGHLGPKEPAPSYLQPPLPSVSLTPCTHQPGGTPSRPSHQPCPPLAQGLDNHYSPHQLVHLLP